LGYGSIFGAGHLQATLNKLLTYCLLRSTQPRTLSGMGKSSSLWDSGWRPNVVADWCGSMSDGCKPQVQLFPAWREQWMAA